MLSKYEPQNVFQTKLKDLIYFGGDKSTALRKNYFHRRLVNHHATLKPEKLTKNLLTTINIFNKRAGVALMLRC